MLFDSAGQIYLAGGRIGKIQGGTSIAMGQMGDLAMKGQDTLYVVENSMYHARKIRVIKRIGGVWIEEYPVSIPPFCGGGLGPYYVYYSGPFYSFFADNMEYRLFSLLTAQEVRSLHNAKTAIGLQHYRQFPQA